MNVTIIYNSDNIRVHKTGCRDIARETRRPPTTMYAMDAETRQEVANDFYSDFINEGSMTEDEAMSYSDFLPCTAGLSDISSGPSTTPSGHCEIRMPSSTSTVLRGLTGGLPTPTPCCGSWVTVPAKRKLSYETTARVSGSPTARMPSVLCAGTSVASKVSDMNYRDPKPAGPTVEEAVQAYEEGTQRDKMQRLASYAAKSTRLEQALLRAVAKAGAALAELKEARSDIPQIPAKVSARATEFRSLDAEANKAYLALLEHISEGA